MTVKGFCLRSVAVVAALWVTEVATLLLPRGDHLLWQLDSWLYWLAVVATVAMTLGVTILVCRRRHWLLQVTCWVVWLVNLLGLMAVMLVLAVCVDRLPGQCCWEQDSYLIRCDDVDCNQVLYERRGMVEHRLHIIWYAWPDAPDTYSICTCREHDMLLLECYDYYKNRDYRLLHLDGTAYEGDIDTLLCSHLAKKIWPICKKGISLQSQIFKKQHYEKNNESYCTAADVRRPDDALGMWQQRRRCRLYHR